MTSFSRSLESEIRVTSNLRNRIAHMYDQKNSSKTIKSELSGASVIDATAHQIERAVNGEDPFPYSQDVYVRPAPTVEYKSNRQRRRERKQEYRNRPRGRF